MTNARSYESEQAPDWETGGIPPVRAHTHTPEIDNIIRTAILTPTLNRPEIRESCAFIEQEAQKVKQHNHDLLEALKTVARFWPRDLGGFDSSTGQAIDINTLLQDTIAKAEGRE